VFFVDSVKVANSNPTAFADVTRDKKFANGDLKMIMAPVTTIGQATALTRAATPVRVHISADVAMDIFLYCP
jgi:hypothetical protein